MNTWHVVQRLLTIYWIIGVEDDYMAYLKVPNFKKVRRLFMENYQPVKTEYFSRTMWFSVPNFGGTITFYTVMDKHEKV